MNLRDKLICLMGCLWLGCGLAQAQEQQRQAQTSASTPAKVEIVLQISPGKVLRLSGMAVFTPAQIRADDTLTGKLTFELPANSRQLLARDTQQPMTEIPEQLTVNEVVAHFEKQPTCPELRFEFAKTKLSLAGVQGQTEPFTVVISETEQALSRLLCWCARSISRGQGRCPYNAINKVLQGEKIE